MDFDLRSAFDEWYDTPLADDPPTGLRQRRLRDDAYWICMKDMNARDPEWLVRLTRTMRENLDPASDEFALPIVGTVLERHPDFDAFMEWLAICAGAFETRSDKRVVATHEERFLETVWRNRSALTETPERVGRAARGVAEWIEVHRAVGGYRTLEDQGFGILIHLRARMTEASEEANAADDVLRLQHVVEASIS